MFLVRQRGFRDQRPQAGLVGGVGEEEQLLVHDDELGAQLLDTFGGLGQALLDEPTGHGTKSVPTACCTDG